MSSVLAPHPDTLLHAVLDSVGVALAVVDSEGRFVFTNQAALKMFGVAGSLNGLSYQKWRRNYVIRDSQMRPLRLEDSPIRRAFSGNDVPPQDLNVILPDGRSKWMHAAGHSFSVLGMKGALVIVTDETEEVELRRNFERAQRAEVLGLLAGGLVHDLNNILSVISGNVALLQTDEGVSGEAAQARLQKISVALKKGSALAAKLADYSSSHEPQICPVQINDLVNAALELVQPLLSRQVRVKIELGSLPAVEVDASRIEQVLVNLILNSLDAMPKGGQLTLRTELVEGSALVEIESGEDKRNGATRFVCVTVADTGIGIPEKLQSKIFDPFFTTKPNGKGSGLGLASSYAIVRQLDGCIKVKSAPGAGAKFSVYLPAKAS